MITERQQLFLKVITPLFQAQQTVLDSFFNNRLNQEIESILEKHIQYCLIGEDQIRRQQANRDYIKALKNIVTFIEEIIYLKKGESIPLAIAHERLLFYLREILRDIKSFDLETPTVSVEIVKPEKEIHQEDIPERKPIRIREKRSNSSRNNILEFLRLAPERRSREIINEFSALSERTVKRNLKELSNEGLIVKKSENRAVYYSAV